MQFGQDPVFDLDGRLYITGAVWSDAGRGSMLWSSASDGGDVFTLESDDLEMGPLAVAPGFVFGEGIGAVLPDGGVLYSRDPQYPFSCGPPVIAADENVFTQEGWMADGGVETPDGFETFGLVEIGDDGGTRGREPLWNGHTFALGNSGTVFALPSSALQCYPESLPSDTAKAPPPAGPILAISAGTQKTLWSIDAGWRVPALALTPGASLLVCDADSVQAFFAGREGPSTTAPWSRARGSNDNRSCPAAQ